MSVTNPTFEGLAHLLGLASGEKVRNRKAHLGELRVAESLLVDRPLAEVYQRWRTFEDLPRILTLVQRVEVLDERRSHWVVRAPPLAGGTMTWEVELDADVPGERLAWHTRPGASVEHAGLVRFEASPRGTLMNVDFRLRAPEGRSALEVTRALGGSPEERIRHDLRNFKRTLEAGEVPTIEGQPHGTCIRRKKSD